ncbi:unnamed protein product [Tetraodon nigroviridis]|uniref:(spotted green pufferfish) hypothetical protein n=1 Tax=Tetraodon nigroviridis TaxID=99883 RepID=Q4SA69_TETNG|nr:unnamed protein product [Tetraodon nigroviridis]
MVLTDGRFGLSPAGLCPLRQTLRTLEPVDELKKGPFTLQAGVLMYRQREAGVEVDLRLSATSRTGALVWESLLTLVSSDKLQEVAGRLPSRETNEPDPEDVKRVELCHDYQRVAFKAHPGNGHATQDGPHRPGVGPDSRSSWVVDSSSQGESTDPQETLTESSTLTFVDAHAAEESSSLGGVATVRLREFVLIDDDDDGDMSLREKTVTDVSVTGGAAADLQLQTHHQLGDEQPKVSAGDKTKPQNHPLQDAGAVSQGVLVEGYSLDVCATCHANATCDDKKEGSGKVCNCKYGFVGNGRNFCEDKDECQIESNKICGQKTSCHNTYGSYYCTCLSGYRASNNMAVFTPNDGTHCRDVDECSIAGLCGAGAQCTNLPGGFECRCQLGYRVQNGKEPFDPGRDGASCTVVDCGPPASAKGVVLLAATGTTYSSVATFMCDEGFRRRRSGDNSSVCGADGRWSPVSLWCEEIDCGPPLDLPHAHTLWNSSSRMGAEVFYQCHYGYHNAGEGNVSVCAATGQWEKPGVLCRETSCGRPPVVDATEQTWNNNSSPGSTVVYFCKDGFSRKEGENVSVCDEKGQWSVPSLVCKGVSDIVSSASLWDIKGEEDLKI